MENQIELTKSEYEVLKENSDQYNVEFKDYIDELINDNVIIDKQIDAEMYIYSNLHIKPCEFNIEKIKFKINMLSNYVKYLEKEVYVNE